MRQYSSGFLIIYAPVAILILHGTMHMNIVYTGNCHVMYINYIYILLL